MGRVAVKAGTGAGGGGGGRESASEPEPESDDDDDDDTVWATDTSAAAAAARAAEQLTEASAAMVSVAAEELERKASLEAAAAAVEESDSEDEEDERIGRLRGFVAQKTPEETAIYLLSETLGVESAELGIHFLVEALFDEEQALAPQIVEKKLFLIKACAADPEKLQLAVLCAVELYVTTTSPDDFKKLVIILKSLYDEDVCDETAILKWASDPNSGKKFGVDAETAIAARKTAKPFVEWLQESDDE